MGSLIPSGKVGEAMRYRNRKDAGEFLAGKLMVYANRPEVLVLALPRGGVPVAFEVARLLKVPLDVFIVRKLGLPGHEEFAMGAIASGGIRILNSDVVRTLRIPDDVIESVTAHELVELERRERIYRGNSFQHCIQGQTIILVDDGLATGSTMLAALSALRQQDPARVIVAVPVGAPDTCKKIRDVADEIICGQMPDPFYAVGFWYDDFTQTTDNEVIALLKKATEEFAVSNCQVAVQ